MIILTIIFLISITFPPSCRLQLKGPNGIGKTTFLEEISNSTAKGKYSKYRQYVMAYLLIYLLICLTKNSFVCLIDSANKQMHKQIY